MNLKDLVDKATAEENELVNNKRESEKRYAIEWLKENSIDISTVDESQYPLVIDGANIIIAEKIGTKNTYIRAITICSTCKGVVWTTPQLSITSLAKAIAQGDACNEHVADECMVKGKEIPMLDSGIPVPPSWRKK